MRSKANVSSHPLHPILVAFPIAFFTGSFVFDLLSMILDKNELQQTAYYCCIAGIIMAVLAAIPGAIDYFKTVPPGSSAKKRATKHALINVINLLLFIYIFYYRSQPDNNHTVVVVLEGLGMILLSIAGWMGGTLVYRNQIGVDHRYAFAGKWKETTVEEGQKIEVAAINELKLNQMKLIHLKDERIVLGRTENGYVAFTDKCTHRGASLADGSMICGTVQCPWHGSQFDVNTGSVKAGPAGKNIQIYKIAEEEGKVFLLM